MREFLNNASRFLSQPSSFETTTRRALGMILGVCVFVFLFLLVFRPFGLKYLGEDLLYVRIAENAGLIFLVLSFNLLLLPKVFKNFFSDANWTVSKRLLFALYNLMAVGFFSLFHAHYRGDVPFTLRTVVHFEVYTLLVGGFPVVFLVLLNHIHTLKTHLRTAEKLNRNLREVRLGHRENRLVHLTSENGREVRKLDADRLVLFASADNYVIIFRVQESKIKKEFLRSGLTRIEEALKRRPEFFRCHRSYIVNLRKVTAVAGNSQGYRLTFDQVAEPIPVSRGHAREFRERMEALSQSRR